MLEEKKSLYKKRNIQYTVGFNYEQYVKGYNNVMQILSIITKNCNIVKSREF